MRSSIRVPGFTLIVAFAAWWLPMLHTWQPRMKCTSEMRTVGETAALAPSAKIAVATSAAPIVSRERERAREER
jgi:hypothetical protein